MSESPSPPAASTPSPTTTTSSSAAISMMTSASSTSTNLESHLGNGNHGGLDTNGALLPHHGHPHPHTLPHHPHPPPLLTAHGGPMHSQNSNIETVIFFCQDLQGRIILALAYQRLLTFLAQFGANALRLRLKSVKEDHEYPVCLHEAHKKLHGGSKEWYAEQGCIIRPIILDKKEDSKVESQDQQVSVEIHNRATWLVEYETEDESFATIEKMSEKFTDTDKKALDTWRKHLSQYDAFENPSSVPSQKMVMLFVLRSRQLDTVEKQLARLVIEALDEPGPRDTYPVLPAVIKTSWVWGKCQFKIFSNTRRSRNVIMPRGKRQAKEHPDPMFGASVINLLSDKGRKKRKNSKMNPQMQLLEQMSKQAMMSNQMPGNSMNNPQLLMLMLQQYNQLINQQQQQNPLQVPPSMPPMQQMQPMPIGTQLQPHQSPKKSQSPVESQNFQPEILNNIFTNNNNPQLGGMYPPAHPKEDPNMRQQQVQYLSPHVYNPLMNQVPPNGMQSGSNMTLEQQHLLQQLQQQQIQQQQIQQQQIQQQQALQSKQTLPQFH